MKESKLLKLILSLTFAAVLAIVCVALLKESKKNARELDFAPPTATQEETTSPLPDKKPSAGAKGVRISELMAKNTATLTDENGVFPDYIELTNASSKEINLSTLYLSDSPEQTPQQLPDCLLKGGERVILYADGSDLGGFHLPFALSKDETVCLSDGEGNIVDSAQCLSDKPNKSVSLGDDGTWHKTNFPTPGYPNTYEGYTQWQESLECASPLMISEVMVYNDSELRQKELDYCDWVELKNVSDGDINLKDYCFSDDPDNPYKFPLPDKTLKAGKSIVLICDDGAGNADLGYIKVNFGLDSENENIYLSDNGGNIKDYAALHDIPYRCSYGRLGQNTGWYYFDEPRPLQEKAEGYRYISQAPATESKDGVFNDVKNYVEVKLSAPGDIYFTTDGSYPTAESQKYKGSVKIAATCVLKAVSVEKGAMASRPLTLSYIINENHSLPVVSLSVDDWKDFSTMYYGKHKDTEVAGNLALYDGDQGFSIPCGVSMHGGTSLDLNKKNMSLSFRDVYGKGKLSYDVFADGGVTEFNNLLLRSGQDFERTILRNELLENLTLEFSDSLLTQRSRYSVVYINGEYWGIYAIMEKLNAAYYANILNTDKNSVEIVKTPVAFNSDFYNEVVRFAKSHDMSDEANYEEFCGIFDIDGLIDWLVIEGYSANSDLTGGNVRFCRSSDPSSDGKWHIMLYDMDATLESPLNCYLNVLRVNTTQCSEFVMPLLENPEFKARLLSRAQEVLDSALSNENVCAEIDRLSTLLAPEVERDYERFQIRPGQWEDSLKELKRQISDNDWASQAMNNLQLQLNGGIYGK